MSEKDQKDTVNNEEFSMLWGELVKRRPEGAEIPNFWKEARKHLFDDTKTTSLDDAPTEIKGDFFCPSNLSDSDLKSIQELFSRTSSLDLIKPDLDKTEQALGTQKPVNKIGKFKV